MDRRKRVDGVVDGVGFDLFEAILIAFCHKAIPAHGHLLVVEEDLAGGDGQHFHRFARVKVMLLDSTGGQIFNWDIQPFEFPLLSYEYPSSFGAVKRHRLLELGRFDFGRTRSTSARW